MPKQTKNHRTVWTGTELDALRQMVSEGVPRAVIAKKLGRNVSAIHQKTYELRKQGKIVSDTLTSQDVSMDVIKHYNNKLINHKPWWKRMLGI